jgi:uncharacterized protein YkwD
VKQYCNAFGESELRIHSVKAGPEFASPAAKKPGAAGTIALVIIALLLVAMFFALPSFPALIAKAGQTLFQLGNQQLETIQGFNIYSPLIQNGSAQVSYPPTYDVLSAYALGLINQDRANNSLGPVSLSPNEAGQQHADSMLKYGYFSHYDTQGLKPYMRYTLLGGVGAVSENVASTTYSYPHYTTLSAVEDSIRMLEYSMMYNDNNSLGCFCNNGHRDNILNPLHNKVSIGIAYNASAAYFDEDFENYYANLTVTESGSYAFSMAGPVLIGGVVPNSILIAYDAPPSPKTPAQLDSGPREYDAGSIIGGVLPPCSLACPTFDSGITTYASTWVYNSTQADISFSLSDFIGQSGPGVYTVYLMTGQDTSTAITSISVFVR